MKVGGGGGGHKYTNINIYFECGCCILLLRIYGQAVVTWVRLGGWVGALACDSERTGHYGKSPTNSARNIFSRV